VSTTESIAVVPVGTWQLDPVHSTVGFEVPYLAGTFKGQFREVAAELAVHGGTATLEGTAQVASVDVKDENLDAHLQSPEFFDAERHPELRFVARNLDLDASDVEVAGDITIKGIAKPVVLTGTLANPLTDPYGRERVGLVVETTLDRTDFDLSWNAPLPSGEPALGNDVTIVADLQFVKAA
jgi:polyisoprenoid-binding protein YceI